MTDNYPNPLDEFRSYSYQYVLTVANTTTSLESMIGSDSSQPSPLLSKISSVTNPGQSFTLDNGDIAYLLCDTRRFSAYQINSLTTEHNYGTGSVDNPSMIFTNIKMSIVDSTGLSFFNMLMDIFRNKLQTTRASSFFLLTILFVGHDTSGGTQTISTCNIPLFMLELGWELTGMGAVFDVSFIEIEGAPPAGGGAQYSNSLGSVMSISSKDSDTTLGGIINALEQQLNIQALTAYQKYFNTALAASSAPTTSTNTSTNTSPGTDQGVDITGVQSTTMPTANSPGSTKQMNKLVQYMITIPEAWQSFKVDLSDRSKNEEQKFIAKKNSTPSNTTLAKSPVTIAQVDTTPAYALVSFAPTTTVTLAIEQILNLSQSIIELASEANRKAGTAQTFKTIMTVTSDTSLYLIHIDVFPYNFPMVNTSSQSSDQTSDATPASTSLNPGTSNGDLLNIGDLSKLQNLITYNYLFTGKNADVLDLKIKYMPESAIALDTNNNMGLARLASNGEQGQTAQGAATAAADGQKKSSTFSPDLRAGDPIFYGSKSKDQLNNFATHKTEQLSADQATAAATSKQEFTQTWSYLHYLSSVSLSIQVRGNPNIIRKYADRACRGGIPPHTASISAADLNTLRTSTASTAAQTFATVLQPLETTAKQLYYTQYVKPRIDSFTKSTLDGDQLTSGADVSVLPVFCKINIRAPNIDYTTGTTATNSDGSAGPLYSDEYFFNGAYTVMTVRTNFSSGEFSHDLSLIPYLVSDTTTKNDQTSTPLVKPVGS